MTRHVSTENLARFRGGELSPARSARIAAHLRTCAQCRETSEALAQVPSLLASVEVPPMPAHLTARIESALAAESAHRAASEPDGVPEHRRTARSAGGARRRPRRPVLAMPGLRVAAALAAAVVVVGGSVTLLTQLGTGASSGSGAGAASAPSAQHRTAILGRRAAPGFTTYGGVHYQVGRHTAVITPQYSGTHYQSARLTQQVSHVLATGKGKMGLAVPNVTPNSTATGHSVLPGCVNRIAAGHTVQLVDIARYEGQRATIIVIARHGQVAAEVWVVGAACSATASDVLTHRPLPRG